MSHFGSGVEQALHCLLFLVDREGGGVPSARDLAEFQGVSTSYVAKLFTALEKAGIVKSEEGVRGGFRLARPATEISVLEVVDVIEGEKPLFRCREVRRDFILFGDDPPKWATRGVCAIHGVMIEAERSMRETLAGVSLNDLAERSSTKMPNTFRADAENWFEARQVERGAAPESRNSQTEKRRRS